MRRISSTAGIPTAKPPIAAPPMNAMMLNMLCNLQPKKSLGEINPPVVKFAGNAQPLGSLRVVAFKRLQEISGALGCVGALNDGGIVGPLARFGRTIKRWRSEEHTSELQSLMRISYAVFRLQKKTTI